MSVEELIPYYNFYENIMKTLFHNFKSLYEDMTDIENPETWRQYKIIN
jgi:hypothetical protein